MVEDSLDDLGHPTAELAVASYGSCPVQKSNHEAQVLHHFRDWHPDVHVVWLLRLFEKFRAEDPSGWHAVAHNLSPFISYKSLSKRFCKLMELDDCQLIM